MHRSRVAWLCGVLVVVLAPSLALAQISPFRGSRRVAGLNPADTQMLFDAAQQLNEAAPLAVGDKRAWQNAASGNSGTVTATRLFQSGGLDCHALRYDLVFKANRPARTYSADWCKTAKGEWKIKG